MLLLVYMYMCMYDVRLCWQWSSRISLSTSKT